VEIPAIGFGVTIETFAADRWRRRSRMGASISVSRAGSAVIRTAVAWGVTAASQLSSERDSESGNQFVFGHFMPAGNLMLLGASGQGFACQSAK
jgi:hypothetical protein